MKHTVITIARSYGSGGRTLGKLLAKELGIHCYDRELLRMASEQSGINEALFGQVRCLVSVRRFTRVKYSRRKAMTLYLTIIFLTIRPR